MLRRKTAPRPARPDRSGEFASYRAPAVRAVMASNLDQPPAACSVAPAKLPERVQPQIRESARGEACTVRLPGVCLGGTEATIWSHGRWASAGKGGALKALDLCGAYACTACDAVFDGQARPPAGMSRDAVDLAWFHGHLRSLLRLRQKDIV